MKKITLVITLILFMLGIVGCAANKNGIISDEVLKELSTVKYAGRLVGTQGNKDAENYLENYMKKIGLQSLDDKGYKISYKQLVADPNGQKPTVTITFKDGTQKKLVHGKDFYTNAATKTINTIIPITQETTDISDEARLTAWDKFTLVVGTPDGTEDFKVNISQALKDKLVSQGAVSAKVTADFAGDIKELSNVVGVIKGNGSTQDAVVLMAHFDHVGKQGDFAFNGVLDNASGVATLMSTASKLMEADPNKKMDYDIIIAAVNSEETNSTIGEFSGSDALVKTLKATYNNLISVNFDCVGNGEPLYMGYVNEIDAAITEKLTRIFTNNKIKFVDEQYCLSDATSFANAGYPSITVGTLLTGEFSMHNVNMKTSDISIEELENISKSVAELVLAGDLFELKIETTELEEGSREWFNQLREVAAQQQGGIPLNLNQFMYVNFNDKLVQIFGATSIKNIDEFNKHYSTIKIPRELYEYSFSSIDVSASDVGFYGIIANKKIPKEFNINEAYSLTPDPKNIVGLVIEYLNEQGGITLYVNRHNGELLESSEYAIVTPINIPNYGEFKLISQNKADGYYSIAKETDEFIVKISCFKKDNTETSFSKDELVTLAQNVFSAENS